MIDFIITDILKAEGWDKYTDRPNDRGGPTKWGITLAAWEDYQAMPCTAEDIMAITETQARKFYEEMYIRAPRFDELPPMLAPLVIDCGVNHGPRAASKWVQRAVRARQDGILGPKSLQAVSAANPVAVYLKVLASRIRLYGKIVTRDPTQAENAHGWNNRAAKWTERLAEYITGG